MKILFLTSRLPYPPYRGDKLKMWNLMKQLSKRHSITLVTFIASEREGQWIGQLSTVCKEIHLVRLPLWRSVLNCLAVLTKRIPFQVAYYSSHRMQERLAEVLNEVEPDVIHTHLIRMAQYTNSLADHVRVLDLTDAVSLYLERFLQMHKNVFVRFLLHSEFNRMTEYERIIQDFDSALVCSEMDQQALLHTAPSARIQILPNGVDLETFYNKNSIKVDAQRIIFTGNMSYYPNIDGARFFVNKIFPIIQRELPDTHLWLVGQNPPRQVRRLASENIVVTGFVEDITAEYLKSAVAVSPIRFGAGTLNKILEPLALGIPVVTTSFGIQGLNLKANEEISVADDAEGFAAAVVRVLKNPNCRELARVTMQRVRTRFGWNQIAEDLDLIYEGIIRSNLSMRTATRRL